MTLHHIMNQYGQYSSIYLPIDGSLSAIAINALADAQQIYQQFNASQAMTMQPDSMHGKDNAVMSRKTYFYLFISLFICNNLMSEL